jgi:hypothetical protein
MAQVIVINSPTTQTGKTLLTAHLAVMLAKDYQTAVLDNVNNSPLAMFVAKRYTLNLGKDYNLPIPQYYSLKKSVLSEIDSRYDAIILDSPDTEYFQAADVLLTMLRGKDALQNLTSQNSLFASLIWEAKKQRAAAGKNTFRWIVCPNDDYSPENMQQLKNAGRFLGFTVAPLLNWRDEYGKGLQQGITVSDKDRPELKTLFDLPDLYARRNLKKLTDFIWQNK